MIQSTAVQHPLAEFRWRKRVLLIFVPGDRGRPDIPPRLGAAIEDQRAELSDRDFSVYAVALPGGPARAVHPTRARLGRESPEARLVRPPHPNGDALLRHYRPEESSATVVLVGKDGTEKRRRGVGSGDLSDLFELVDAMPMRRREMRERGA
jgi:hypothetical protein